MAHVTIPDTLAEAVYESVTGTGPLNFTFPWVRKTDIKVRVNGTLLADNAWSVAGQTTLDGGFVGGNITLVSSVSAAKVIATRETEPGRTTDFAAGGAKPTDINTALDLIHAVMRDFKTLAVKRGIRFGAGDPTELIIPDAVTRANTILAFGPDGAYNPSSKVNVDIVASISAAIQAVADISASVVAVADPDVIAALELLATVGNLANLEAVSDPVVLAALEAIKADLDLAPNSNILNALTNANAAIAARAAAEVARDKAVGYSDADLNVPVEYTGQAEGTEVLTFNPATAVVLATNVITYAGHGLLEGQQLQYRKGSGGTIMGSTGGVLTDNLNVYAVETTTNTFKISLTEGGTAIDLTTIGAGTSHQFYPVRSAKHHAYKAKGYADSARSDAINTADDRAAIQSIFLGDFANAGDAWASPNAVANRSYYFNTTTNQNRVLGSVAPADSPFIQSFASQAEAEAGVVTGKNMDPALTAAAIAALAPAPTLSSQAEAEAGTNNTKSMTPLRVRQAIKIIAEWEHLKEYPYVGDGTSHPVSEWLTGGALDRGYANLAAIQADFPHVAATTDEIDWACIQAALNTNRDVFLPFAAGYFTNRVLQMTQVGQRLRGARTGEAAQIIANHTSGDVLNLRARGQEVEYLLINASNARNAEPYGLNRGIVIGGNGLSSITGFKIKKCIVTRQPGDAYMVIKEAVGGEFDSCYAQDNKGHGFVADDGTIDATTVKTRCGMLTFEACRSTGNGGNAAAMAPNGGQSCYRFTFNNFEAFDCAWNLHNAGTNPGGIVGLVNAQLYGLVENLTVAESSGFDDTNYNATTLANGDARIAKATRSQGIWLTGGDYLEVSVPRFLNLSASGTIGANFKGLDIDAGYVALAQSIGWTVGSGCTGEIRIVDSSFYSTTPVDAESAINVKVDNLNKKSVPGSNSLFGVDEVRATTISANTINALAGTVLIEGQGDAADDLQGIYFAGGGVPLPDGYEVKIINIQPYNITLKDGLSNLFTSTGADKTLAPDQAVTFVANGGNVYEVAIPGAASSVIGIIAEGTVGSTVTLTAINTETQILQLASVVIAADGLYEITASMTFAHRDANPANYSMRVKQDASLIDVHGYKSVKDAATAEEHLFCSKKIALTAGTYNFTSYLLQDAGTVFAQVFANSTSNRSNFMQIVRLA